MAHRAEHGLVDLLDQPAGLVLGYTLRDLGPLDGIEPGTIPNLLTLGQDAYDYDVNVFMLSFTYRWETIKRDANWPQE